MRQMAPQGCWDGTGHPQNPQDITYQRKKRKERGKPVKRLGDIKTRGSVGKRCA